MYTIYNNSYSSKFRFCIFITLFIKKENIYFDVLKGLIYPFHGAHILNDYKHCKWQEYYFLN